MTLRTPLSILLAALPVLAEPSLPYSRDTAARLIGDVITDPLVFGRLAHLTDSVGPRLSGGSGHARAVEWTAAQLKADGVEVRLEKVMVPHWVRGEETAAVVASQGRVEQPLSLTALGGSAGTPEGGLEAEVVMVRSVEEAAALGEKARGRIVFFQGMMKQSRDYGAGSTLRVRGPAAAASQGAVAALVRSAATASFRSPHTGVTLFDKGQPIPAAAVSTEDADLLERLITAGAGPVRVRLKLGCKTLPDVESANVVAELKGREKPDEIVLLGGHLDSWDLATGAIDDGAGVAMVMAALRGLARLPQHPRRTVRVVLFANEENGSRGSRGYRAAHAAELARHVAAIEMDAGAGRATSISAPNAPAVLGPWIGREGPLAGLGVTDLDDGGHGGADIGGLAEDAQVPMVDVNQEGSRYFDIHHSAADTLDKVDPQQLRQAAATVAWVAYALAEMPGTLDRRPPKPRR